MSKADYSPQAVQQMREKEASVRAPERQTSLLEQISPDAPMDDATITAWTSDRFMDYDTWRAKRPVAVEEKPESAGKRVDTKARAKASEQEGLWEE